MDKNTISIKQTRDNLAEIIDKVAFAGQAFIITKFGKVKAMIVTYKQPSTELLDEDKMQILNQIKDFWLKRTNIKFVSEWYQELRQAVSTRKISSNEILTGCLHSN